MVHTVIGAATTVNDSTLPAGLLTIKRNIPGVMHATKGVHKRQEKKIQGRSGTWPCAGKRETCHTKWELPDCWKKLSGLKRVGRASSSTRSAVIKEQFVYAKVRYRGPVKNG